jgi:hypothetical protein
VTGSDTFVMEIIEEMMHDLDRPKAATVGVIYQCKRHQHTIQQFSFPHISGGVKGSFGLE